MDASESGHTGSAQSDEVPSDDIIEGVRSHAIFVLDSDGVVSVWSTSAQALYGYESAEMEGSHVRGLFAEERSGESDPMAAETFADTSKQVTEIEGWHERADGSVFWATLTLSPLGNEQSHRFTAISRDTTEIRAYEQMLERQNDRLKEFTDILAHDLQTPLQIIDGRLMLYDETGDDEHIESISVTVDRMARLVDDLLRVARQGDILTDPEPADLEPIVESAWDGATHDTSATLRYEAVPSVSTDPDRLHELFENLFCNAVEHAGEDVTVRVGPLETGFYVEDNGPGIPEGIRDRVFDHGVTTSDDGSGYGLSIVRTIANAHGWDVSVTESGDGGARFTVTGIAFVD
ncbi:Signal transduction histidine kinase [Halapricum desulfuricans]|uniref:histidine kinase n=1 Tax=Halapricum desulfuricans TaxID=2841257 RepID=A0A897NIY1_9EURY|nr:PAS domain-containing sensor histidine kinase [Halapricum desulfuricans]QSG12281.1 Signal transduction histidine kinase [Halapricum desulfuricans]